MFPQDADCCGCNVLHRGAVRDSGLYLATVYPALPAMSARDALHLCPLVSGIRN